MDPDGPHLPVQVYQETLGLSRDGHDPEPVRVYQETAPYMTLGLSRDGRARLPRDGTT